MASQPQDRTAVKEEQPHQVPNGDKHTHQSSVVQRPFRPDVIQNGTNTNGVYIQQQPAKEANMVALANPMPVTPLHLLQATPEWIDCPFCERRTKTRISKEDSTMTMIAGVLLCLVCICAACVPCLCGWCQDVDHYCTNCGAKVTHQPHDGTVQVMQNMPSMKQPSQYANAGSGNVPPELQPPPPAYQQ